MHGVWSLSFSSYASAGGVWQSCPMSYTKEMWHLLSSELDDGEEIIRARELKSNQISYTSFPITLCHNGAMVFDRPEGTADLSHTCRVPASKPRYRLTVLHLYMNDGSRLRRSWHTSEGSGRGRGSQ